MEAICAALQQTFSPDKAQRLHAEGWLKENAVLPTFVTSLLEIVAKPDDVVPKPLKQAAAISLKNILHKQWAVRLSEHATEEEKAAAAATPVVADADKAVLKQNFVAVIATLEDKSLRKLVTEAAMSVARADFPDAWPELLPGLVANLQSQDTSVLYNMCFLLRHLTKMFEYKPEELRGPLNVVIEQTFPYLEQIFQGLVQMEEVAAADLMKLIIKTFWSGVQLRLPPYVMVPEKTNIWLSLLNQVLERDVDGLGMPEDPDERAKWPWWKAKQWALQIFCRIFTRFGHPKFTDDTHREFTKHWVENLATTVTATALQVLTLRCQGRYCPDRIMQLGLDFLESGLELGATFTTIEPHFDGIVGQVIFPLLVFNDEDAELWEDDPHEYCRKSYDAMEEFYDPRMSGVNFLNTSIKLRTQTCLPRILAFFQSVLGQYQSTAPEARTEEMHRGLEGALGAIGSMQTQLMENPKHFSDPEGLLTTFVFPQFQHPRGYLRARACWMLQQFAQVELSQADAQRQAVQALLQTLNDPDLPVRMQAATAIKYVLEGQEPDEDEDDDDDADEEGKAGGREPSVMKQVMLPVLPAVLGAYFSLMSEIGIDEVVSALQTIIAVFREHIAPHAVDIANKLAESFVKYIGASDAEGEADDEAALAAMNCLEAVCTLLLSLGESHPAVFPALEAPLLPLLARMMDPDGIEYLEQTLNAITYFTYYSPEPLSANLWNFFPLLMSAYYGWGNDYIAEFAAPLDNFITRGTDVFLTGSSTFSTAPLGMDDSKRAASMVTVTHKEALLHMAQRTLEGDACGPKAIVEVCRLLGMLLHAAKGRADDVVPVVLGMVVKRINTAGLNNPERVQAALLVTVASASYYNPVLMLRAMQELGGGGDEIIIQLLHLWMQLLPAMRRLFDKKVAALGLTALLQIPVAEMPAPLQGGVDTLLMKTIEVLVNAERQAEQIAELDEEEEEEEEDEDDDEDGDEVEQEGLGDGEDATTDEDEAYMKYINEMRKKLAEQQFRGAAGTLDDFEDEEEEEWEAESTSPLDSVSQLAFFAAVAKTLPAELWQKVPAEVRTAAEQLCKKSEEEEQEN
eukprot:g681.t1